MKKSTIKTFKRFIKEEKEKYYTLDLYQDMTNEEVVYYSNQLLQLTLKMLNLRFINILLIFPQLKNLKIF
jgi:hypothetical protein